MKSFIRNVTIFCMVCIFCGLFKPTTTWAGEGNIDTTNKYAWLENAGWFNFRPTDAGVTVYDAYLSGYAWAENIGWVKLGSGTGPYGNTTSSNWGVNRDSGTGGLSGYAWSEIAGWINFNSSNSQVIIDPATGSFDGYAWSENVGWIHFKDDPTYNVKLATIGAGTYYVNIESGSDSDDGSSGAPWKTLHFAIAQINGGSTGTYTLYVAPGGSSTYYRVADGEADTELIISQDTVTVVAEAGTIPIIDGANAQNWTRGLEITGSSVTVKSLHVTGFSDVDEEGIRITNGAENRIYGCSAYGNNWGIRVSHATDSIIDRCDIFDNLTHGIDIIWSNNTVVKQSKIYRNFEYGIRAESSPIISRNLIFDNTIGILIEAFNNDSASPTIKNNVIYQTVSGAMSFGIFMRTNNQSTVNPEIYHNTIDGGTLNGIILESDSTSSASPLIKYNIISNFGVYGIQNQGGNPIIDYNDVWNNAGGNYEGCSAGANDIHKPPLYGSYELKSTSPCIDAISLDAGDPVTLDYQGFKRPKGAGFDMGAYEYAGTQVYNYLLPGGTGQITDYRIFTVPFYMTGAQILAAMENVLGPYNNTGWRGFASVSGNYLEFNDGSFQTLPIIPGMGFWMISLRTDTIPFEGETAPDGVDYEKGLSPGWHIIALPWVSENMNLGSIKVTDGINTYAVTSSENTLTQRCVWDYTGIGPFNGYEKQDLSTDNLQCGAGYFFKVISTKNVTIIIPPKSDASSFRRGERGSTGDEEEPPPPPGGSAEFSCPDISNGLLEDFVFPSTANCPLYFKGTLTIKNGVTIKNGATVTIKAIEDK